MRINPKSNTTTNSVSITNANSNSFTGVNAHIYRLDYFYH